MSDVSVKASFSDTARMILKYITLLIYVIETLDSEITALVDSFKCLLYQIIHYILKFTYDLNQQY